MDNVEFLLKDGARYVIETKPDSDGDDAVEVLVGEEDGWLDVVTSGGSCVHGSVKASECVAWQFVEQQ
jgi:hypothetical protein